MKTWTMTLLALLLCVTLGASAPQGDGVGTMPRDNANNQATMEGTGSVLVHKYEDINGKMREVRTERQKGQSRTQWVWAHDADIDAAYQMWPPANDGSPIPPQHLFGHARFLDTSNPDLITADWMSFGGVRYLEIYRLPSENDSDFLGKAVADAVAALSHWPMDL